MLWQEPGVPCLCLQAVRAAGGEERPNPSREAFGFPVWGRSFLSATGRCCRLTQKLRGRRAAGPRQRRRHPACSGRARAKARARARRAEALGTFSFPPSPPPAAHNNAATKHSRPAGRKAGRPARRRGPALSPARGRGEARRGGAGPGPVSPPLLEGIGSATKMAGEPGRAARMRRRSSPSARATGVPRPVHSALAGEMAGSVAIG